MAVFQSGRFSNSLAAFSGLLICLVLTACGGGGGGGGGDGGSAPPAPPAPPPPVAVTPVGKPFGAMVQQMVPTTGGTLVSFDGRLTLEVPSGALASAQTLSIQAINNESPQGRGVGYRLSPDGTTFAAPVKLTFKYEQSEIAGSEVAALGIAFQNNLGQWAALNNVTRDAAAKTIAGETTHFTDVTKLTGWQLRPVSTSLASGGAVDLHVEVCARKPATGPGDDELSSLVVTCAPDEDDLFVVNEWAANGVTNGNATVGTVMSTGVNAARYVAPNATPPNNPVSVSASMTEKTSGRKTLLSANVWVDARPPYNGSITSTQVNDSGGLTDILTTTAGVRMLYNINDGAYQPSAGLVNARLDIIDGVAGCETHLTYSGALLSADGFMTIQDGSYIAGGNKIDTMSGTTNCNINKTTEPISLQVGVLWWPAPAGPFTAKPDGRLEESFFNLSGGGRTVDVHWTLTPE